VRRGRAAVAVAAVALAAAGCGGGPHPVDVAKTDAGTARSYGRLASSVWVLTPRHASIRSVVVFLHGWSATSPFDWHEVWLDHLLANGSAVVFPVYQWSGDGTELVVAPLTLRDGLQKGFRALGHRDLPVVAVGYSVGAALAFYYAADAAGWGVPAPSAVVSIFPIDPIEMDPGLARLGAPPRIPYLIFAGDRDYVVGTAGARAFLRWLAPVPERLKTYHLLRSDPGGLWFDHESPHEYATPGIRRIFWGSLDAAIDRARA
jgi:pimeloyl-ACP methyl ester carboxylesterase